MIRKLSICAALGLSLAATPLIAGDASMKNANGDKLTINCKNSGCKVRMKPKGSKWSTIEKGPGGRDNFKVLKAKYEGMGYQ